MTDAPDLAPRPDDRTAEEVWLRCRSCEGRIAREKDRIEVNGSHRHEFMNPAGLRFVVGCFGAVVGLVAVGERSSVWTWFPGHAWQAASCSTCGEHLGWSFTPGRPGASASFHGLILAQLV